MAAKNRIDVYLHDVGNNQQATGDSNTAATAISQNDNATTASAKGVSKGMAVASVIGNGAFRFVTSNVGKYTGNTAFQTTVNNVVEAGQTVAMFFVNPWIGLANVALQVGTTAIEENFRRNQESVSVNQARARAGYTTDAASYRKR